MVIEVLHLDDRRALQLCSSESSQEYAGKDPLGGDGLQTTIIGKMIQSSKKFGKKDD